MGSGWIEDARREGGSDCPPASPPSGGAAAIRVEEVEDPPDGVIDEVVDRAGLVVKGGDGRRDDRPHAAQRQHMLEVDVVERRLARQQHKPPPLLERDVGRAGNEGFPVSQADCGQRLHAAGGDDHAVMPEGPARDRGALVVAMVDDGRERADFPGAHAGFLDQRQLGPAAEDQVTLDAELRECNEQSDAINGAGGPRHRDYDPQGAPGGSKD